MPYLKTSFGGNFSLQKVTKKTVKLKLFFIKAQKGHRGNFLDKIENIFTAPQFLKSPYLMKRIIFLVQNV